MKKSGWSLAALAGFSLAVSLLGCGDQGPMSAAEDPEAAKLVVSPGKAGGFADRGAATHFSAEVPMAWFELANGLFASERFTPPMSSRALGYAGVALYEAVVPGMPGYQSLAGQLNELGPLPLPKGRNYHWPAVANAALAAVMKGMFSGSSAAAQTAIADLEHKFAAQFAEHLSPSQFRSSAAHGRAVGEAILAWASADGYAGYHNCAYALPTGSPELWVPTPPAFAAAPLEPCWGSMRPLVLAGGSECNPGPPPAYAEGAASQFYREALEVRDAVAHLSDEQKAIALFWADGAGTLTPPGHSISILSQVLQQQDASLATAAEAYARVGIAVADAFISCWWTKYEYNLLRPVTYIQRFIDPNWSALIATPPFPEYTSGHSTQSGAAAQVLTDMFGPVGFADHTHEGKGLGIRSFNSFFAAAEEAAISRLYGGIHYRAAIELGVDQGKCVGNKVSALRFRK